MAELAGKVLVFYGSYRRDRMGIRLANFVVEGLVQRGCEAELIDAQAVGLPMLDRMYKEHAPGAAPPAMEALAQKIKAADAFVFVTGEYNWGLQPGLKNLTDHFLEEWFWRPAAIASYSAGRFSGVRAGAAWHAILSEMGMVSSRARWRPGPSRRRLTSTVSPSATAVMPSGRLFPALPTILRGGLKPRENSERVRALRTSAALRGIPAACYSEALVPGTVPGGCW